MGARTVAASGSATASGEDTCGDGPGRLRPPRVPSPARQAPAAGAERILWSAALARAEGPATVPGTRSASSRPTGPAARPLERLPGSTGPLSDRLGAVLPARPEHGGVRQAGSLRGAPGGTQLCAEPAHRSKA